MGFSLQATHSKFYCHIAFTRQCQVADNPSTVSDQKLRKILTKYGLSDHKLSRLTQTKLLKQSVSSANKT